MFSEINWEKLSSNYKTIPADTVLIKQGSRPTAMYVLVEGYFNIYRHNVLISTLEERGAYLGEIAILMDTNHSATVITLTQCTVIEITLESLVPFLTKSPDLTISLAQNLAKRLVEQNAQLARSVDHPLESLNKKQADNSLDLSAYIDLSQLAHLYKEFRPGVNIIEQGIQPNALYILVEGKVDIIKNEKVIAVESTAGYYMGDVSLLRNAVANATVRCNGVTTMIEIPAAKVETFLKHSPLVALNIAKKLAQRILVIDDEYLNLMAELKKKKYLK